MSENFKIVDTNPNDNVGGGGCLCSESKDTDCQGPYAVFYVHDMASNISPHPVIGANCLRKAAAALDGEVLAGGEPVNEPPQIEQADPVTEETEIVKDSPEDDPRIAREFVPDEAVPTL